MSRTTRELPKGYAPSGELDFDGDKKAKVRLYAAAFLLMAILFFLENALSDPLILDSDTQMGSDPALAADPAANEIRLADQSFTLFDTPEDED